MIRGSVRAVTVASFVLLAVSAPASQAQTAAPPPEVPSIVDQVADKVVKAEDQGATDVSGQGNAIVDVTPGGRLRLLLHSHEPATLDQRAQLAGLGASVISALQPGGFVPDTGITRVLVPAERVDAVANFGWVLAITPAEDPAVNTGAVNSQGVAFHNADDVQAVGIDGTGVTVGVVSDGAVTRQDAINSGDLPNNVTVLDAGTNDEGTAMMEIIHDMAPGAGLMFDGGFDSLPNSLNNLVTNGADVIAHDLAFDAEPAFQRGITAATPDNIAAAGVPVHVAAGNLGQNHTARVAANGTGGGPDGRTFNAVPTGCPYSPTNAVAIAPNGDTTFDLTLGADANNNGTSFTLQWSEPRAIFPTVGAGGFTNLDLFIMDAGLTRCIGQSSTSQANGVGDTIERVVTAGNLTGTTAKIVVNVRGTSSAVAAPTLDLRWRRAASNQDVTTQEGSLDPEVNFTGQAYSVAAINQGGPIETFTGGGPVQIRTTTQCPNGGTGTCTGVAGPAASTFASPAFGAADGVSVTGAGTFGTTFFGTSAASPHSAACDALVRDAINSPNASVATTRARLVNTAVDELPAGVDNITGAGRLDCAASIPQKLSIGNATVTEGNSGTVDANFTVTLANPPSTDVTVDYATAGGTATSGSDFQSTSGTLTFSGGQTSKTITVKVNGDLVDEVTSESFSVNLTNPRNALVTDGSGAGTINDDDEAKLTIDDVTVIEGDSGDVNATFTVSSSNPADRTILVDYATSDDTAKQPSDYAAKSGTLTFSPFDQSETITVPVHGDIVDELNERFFVDLSNPGVASILDGHGVGSITDDDEAKLSIDDVTVTEGNTGTVAATFTVSSSNPADRVITVDFATADDTAKQPGDYDKTTGTLTYQPFDQVETLTVPVRGDVEDELEERYFVNLSNSVVAIITDAQGIGTIVDNDRNGTFTCRASGLRAADLSEPAVANAPNSPCKAAATSTNGTLNVFQATTAQTPVDLTASPPAAGDNSRAHAEAANLTLRVGLNIIRLSSLTADARAECTGIGSPLGPPKLTGSSRVTALSVNGEPVVVTTASVTLPLLFATLRVNQKIVGPREITQRALVVDPAVGNDIVVAEARAGWKGTSAHPDGTPDGHPCVV